MTYTVNLVVGLAELMTGEALGIYRPTTPYQPGETAIVLGRMPAEPERVIALNAYTVEDSLTNAVTGVQARLRAGPDPQHVDALADRLRDLLHEREEYWLRSSVFVSLSWRQSQAWIGQDALGRMELTSNFYFRTSRNTPHLHE
ncbi:minor capsid protein [Streptomyces sp. NPDC055078]